MKTTRFLTTTAMIVTLALSGAAYAQDAGSAGAGDHGGWQKMHEQRDAVLAQLPPEKAKLFKDTMKQAHEKNEATHDQIKKLHQERDAILTADKFDKDAYLAKTKELNKLYEQMRASHEAAFVSVAAQFTPAERKILASLHEEHMHGEHHHMHDGNADGKEMTNQPSSK